jgi:uncharacterized protein (TIGR03032 family)
MSSLYQLWRFENALRPGETYQGCDRLYMPKAGFTTADLDIQDVAVCSSSLSPSVRGVGREGKTRVIFASAKFNCLATLNERYSFTPLWKLPPLGEGYRLTGLAVSDGQPRYVTVAGPSHTPGGGRLLEVPSGRHVAEGLSLPCSPRIHRQRLWLLNAGTGFLGHFDEQQGCFEPVAFCPGFARGWALSNDYAVVGLSRHPHDNVPVSLPLQSELTVRRLEPFTGLQIIDLRSGQVSHWLRLEGMIQQLYDVVVLPAVVRPMAVGLVTDEIQRIIAPGDDGVL